MRKIPRFFILSTFLLIALSNIVLAQQGIQIAPQTVSNATTNATTATTSENWFSGAQCMEISLAPFLSSCPRSPAEYLSALYRLALYAAVIAAIIQITIAGVIYATSGDNTSKQKEARDQIRDAIIGLVLILSSVLILRTINPDLVKLNMPGIQPKLSDQELKEKEEEQIKESNAKLRNVCVEKICDVRFDGEMLKKCAKACDDLYNFTISSSAKECYDKCYNEEFLKVNSRSLIPQLIDQIQKYCALHCQYYEEIKDKK